MMDRQSVRSVPVALLLVLLPVSQGVLYGQSVPRVPATAQQAVAEIRSRYWLQDYEGGQRLADQYRRTYPASAELEAWRVAMLAELDWVPEAMLAADTLAEKHRASRWSTFAWVYSHAMSLETAAAALEQAERASIAAPRDSLMAWLKAFALVHAGRHTQAARFLDTARARFPHDVELCAAAGLVVREMSHPDSAMLAGTLDILARTRALDSTNFSATANTAIALRAAGRIPEALSFFRTALRLSPFAYPVHAAYWAAVQRESGRPPADRRAEIEADINALLVARPTWPEALAVAAYAGYEAALPDVARRRTLEERILRDAPHSARAELIAMLRADTWSDSIALATSPDARARGRSSALRDLEAYIARPGHANLNMLQWALNRRLQFALEDSTTPTGVLLSYARAAVLRTPPGTDVVYNQFPMALAERGTELKWAEQLVRARLASQQQRFSVRRERFATLGEFANAVAFSTGTAHDQLGWIFFKADRIPDAVSELDAALDVLPRNASALYHRGRLAEAQGDEAMATEFYSRGLAAEVREAAKHSTNALRRLYADKWGDASDSGFRAYTAALVQSARERHKAEILAAPPRIRLLPEFVLPRLGGGTVSSESLRGRIVVINVWGVWCGACIQEGPDLEQLFQQYKNDTTVAILSIDYDDAPADAARFVTSRKLTFPVLFDDGWVQRASIVGFPTTLFIDADGHIVFTAGATDDLVLEYSWRIEALKARVRK